MTIYAGTKHFTENIFFGIPITQFLWQKNVHHFYLIVQFVCLVIFRSTINFWNPVVILTFEMQNILLTLPEHPESNYSC